MPIEISHKFICDRCGETTSNEFPEISQSHTDISSTSELPKGWKTYRQLLVCPKHTISKVTYIDDVEVDRRAFD